MFSKKFFLPDFSPTLLSQVEFSCLFWFKISFFMECPLPSSHPSIWGHDGISSRNPSFILLYGTTPPQSAFALCICSLPRLPYFPVGLWEFTWGPSPNHVFSPSPHCPADQLASHRIGSKGMIFLFPTLGLCHVSESKEGNNYGLNYQ